MLVQKTVEATIGDTTNISRNFQTLRGETLKKILPTGLESVFATFYTNTSFEMLF